ncbi:MAG TPA: pyrroline-5-carboxylate reductase [Gammaproteobacteria bacterium]|nr:pyrroline-5-carboxylate reductase [Gammaproteobacteria bacterium]
MVSDTHIAFIGGGNMAGSLLGGLLRKGFDAKHIHVADPDSVQLEHLRQRFQVHTCADNLSAVRDAQVVVFAVKPQVFRDAARPLAPTLGKSRPLIISIAAGVSEKDIRRWLDYQAAIVRVMPNTPALIGAGAAALYANSMVSSAQRTLAKEMFEAVGLALWIDDEKLMNAVTAVSGSGPAYFFLIMDIMETAARELGLPADVARKLVQQTAYGAARMALESQEDVAALRKRVASPGGTTAAALKVLDSGKLREIFSQALTAAHDRGMELSDEFGREKS